MSVVGLLSGCDFENMRKEREVARRALDSVRNELLTHQNLTQTLLEVGVMIDSIDVNRNALRTSMVEGTAPSTYVSRLREINRHIRNTEGKIQSLEKALQQARRTSNATYVAALNKLRGELDVRNQELKSLQERLEGYRLENEQLVNTVGNQHTELNERSRQLKLKQTALDELEAQVKQLLVQSQTDQGDQLFLRAAAVEETANRTRFAPRKKKATRTEALELYRLALALGRTDAQVRIDALQKKL